MNRKEPMNFAVTILFCLIVALVAAAPLPTTINNFDDCLKAGYPTGKSLPEGWERCWTPQVFVKGLNPTISQGVYGKITILTGNCMPGAVSSKPTNACNEFSVDRQVYVTEPVTWSVVKDGFLATGLNPIKQTKSQGSFYEVQLPSGTYSIFVEDQEKKRCTGFGSKGEACQVTVGKNELKEHNIQINHAAH
jgi:hypothetical protein